MARDTANAMPPPAHTIERRLITFVDRSGKPIEKRKRGTVIDGLIGYSDEGYLCLISTGRAMNPPLGEDGTPRLDCDPEDLLIWMLEQDPEAWEKTRALKLGEVLTVGLAERLRLTRESYPRDRKSR